MPSAFVMGGALAAGSVVVVVVATVVSGGGAVCGELPHATDPAAVTTAASTPSRRMHTSPRGICNAGASRGPRSSDVRSGPSELRFM
jgi:hypothetical protein